MSHQKKKVLFSGFTCLHSVHCLFPSERQLGPRELRPGLFERKNLGGTRGRRCLPTKTSLQNTRGRSEGDKRWALRHICVNKLTFPEWLARPLDMIALCLPANSSGPIFFPFLYRSIPRKNEPFF